MRDDSCRNEKAHRNVLEPVDHQRRACRPYLDEAAGSRNGVDGKQCQQAKDPHTQPKTLTALAITSASVVAETSACTVIIALAHRAIGMVSVGENATALVMLT